MGIYIKNMEMPTTCGSCWFCHTVSNEKWHCRLTGKSFESYSVGWGEENNTGDNGQHPYIRRGDCPLVPVPLHDRLIDADEFLKRAIGTKCFRGDYALMLEELVGESTTIIPAEVSET